MSNRLFFCVRQPCSLLSAWRGRGGGAEGGEARLLDARVHVGLVVVADVEHVVVAVDGAGERLQANVRRAAVAGETHHGDVLGRRPLARRPASMPESTAAVAAKGVIIALLPKAN